MGEGDDLGRRAYGRGIVGNGFVDHAASSHNRIPADDKPFFLAGNQGTVHPDVSAFFDMDGIVPLIPAVAGKENPVFFSAGSQELAAVRKRLIGRPRRT